MFELKLLPQEKREPLNLSEHGEQRVDHDGAKQSETEHLGDHVRADQFQHAASSCNPGART